MSYSFIDYPSINYNERANCAPIDMLIFHYTGMINKECALKKLIDPNAKVSTHYLIDEKGGIYKLVDEANRAWHAGVSYWRRNTDINSRSIGVEIVNPGHEFGYQEFTDLQIDAIMKLSRDIISRHPISNRNIVGHSDIAPSRKKDPGELFDWKCLADQGIGLWPEEAQVLEMNVSTLLSQLENIGYEINNIKDVVASFQRHFRPNRVTGRIDPETARKISGLHQLIENLE